MTTKVSDGMTTGLVKTDNLASKAPSSKSSGDEGKVVQLDSSGGVPSAYLGTSGGVLQVRTKALGDYSSSSINGDVLPTGWSETITMAASTNALMITAYSECYHPDSSGNVYVGLKLYEGSTHLTASSSPDSGTMEATALNYASSQNYRSPTQITWIYKPDSASELTFNVYVYGNAGDQGSPTTSWFNTRLTITEIDGSLVNVA